MKTAVIFADGMKQIVFTPENDNEKFALSLMTPEDDIELLLTTGTMYNNYSLSSKPFTATISESQGGYLRIYSNEMSRILVLKPKKELI